MFTATLFIIMQTEVYQMSINRRIKKYIEVRVVYTDGYVLPRSPFKVRLVAQLLGMLLADNL